LKRRPENSYLLKDLLAANVGKRPVLIARLETKQRLSWPGRFTAQAHGWLLRVVPEGGEIPLATYMSVNDRSTGPFEDRFRASEIRPGSWEEQVRDAWIASRDTYAAGLVTRGQAAGNPPELLGHAARAVESLIEIDPDPVPLYDKNLGIIYFRLRPHDPSAEAKMRSAWSRYLERAPLGDPDVARIRSVLAGG
jgi:hypothetical protein